MGKKKKSKNKELSLYQVIVEYGCPLGTTDYLNTFTGVGRKRIHSITVIAYSKKEAVKKVAEQLMYVERPFSIRRVCKASKKTDVKKKTGKNKKKKHNDKMLSLFHTKKGGKSKKLSLIHF